jgi:hypothetical protein
MMGKYLKYNSNNCPGRVGIFWCYKEQIISASVPLESGVDEGDFVNGPYDHISYWEVVRQTHRELKYLEYEEVPRGRVLYEKGKKRFRIYMDKCLFNNDHKKLLLITFCLKETDFDFATDEHYTTNKRMLDKLFSD